MSSITTDFGLDWLLDSAFNETNVVLETVAIGGGDTTNDLDQDTLNDEIARFDLSDPNVSFGATSDAGEFVLKVTVSGGVEVPAGSTITEIAMFLSNDELFYVEGDKNIDVDSGERITIESSTVVVNK